MTTRNAESSQPSKQGEGGNPPPPPPPPGSGDNQQFRGGNMVFKSGPLFISSKGIGWTSWKKRWFILTRTSLVFFRSDPNAVPQKGSEVNLILGGIDLNNSGSVVVKADKKLLTVLFPDGRDGRAFTLKAETLEDLNEWKSALENALSQAPSATAMGQNGIFKNEQADGAAASSEQSRDKQPIKTSVIGRPVLLALEDVDGSPSFLEKALRFIEEHGVKVEGILRQAADVEDVERRIRDYEQGKAEFSPNEDAHVIGDCIKYILREMPSSPVPASCCNALLEASRADRSIRVIAIREAICETFPEPNRRLLQRILVMMQSISTHKEKNRMSSSAVAACMAPLLLRPLLAGDCEIEHDFDVGGDGSAQLLQAAAAANHAQAIVITLLEEYDNIFREGTMSPEIYSDTEDSGTGSEDATDDDYSYEDDEEDDGTEGSDANTEDHNEYTSGGSSEEIGYSGDDIICDEKGCESSSSISNSPKESDDSKTSQICSSSQPSLSQHDNIRGSNNVLDPGERSPEAQASESAKQIRETSPKQNFVDMIGHGPLTRVQKSSPISNGAASRRTVWGRTSAKKNLSMESIDCPLEDDDEIQQLELSKVELQNKIAEEVKGNSVLQSSLERRKKDLREHRLSLENEVERLQEQLQKHREWRMTVEAGLSMSLDPSSFPESIDEKTKTDIMEIAEAERDVANLKQKVGTLGEQLLQQQESVSGSMHILNQSEKTSYYQGKQKEKERDIDMAAAFNFERSAGNKDKLLDGAALESEKKLESASVSNLVSNQNYLADPVHNSSSKSSPTTKRSGSRGEGSSSTTSALSKLTNRLNFLKERRSQIANELHNMEKGRVLSQSSEKIESDSRQVPRDLESIQAPERRRGTLENSRKGVGTEGELQEVSEKLKKSSIQSTTEEEVKKRSRSRSGGKGQGNRHESGSSVPPKTHSR